MSKDTNNFSPEIRECAVRKVLDCEGQHGSRWQAITSMAAKIGCSADRMNDWVKKAKVDSGRHAGIPSDIAERMKALERELRQANKILRKGETIFRHWSENNRRMRILRWRGSTTGRSYGGFH